MQFKMGVTCRAGDTTQGGPWSGFLYTYDRCHMINTLEAGVMTTSALLENADTTRDIFRNYIVWLILHITSEDNDNIISQFLQLVVQTVSLSS